MASYKQISDAMNMLGLNENETIADVKKKINSLIKKWHPDKCSEKENEEMYIKKSISLLEAKEIIMDYCENYKISFAREEVEKYLSPDEFWEQKFGKDPAWGNTGNPYK